MHAYAHAWDFDDHAHGYGAVHVCAYLLAHAQAHGRAQLSLVCLFLRPCLCLWLWQMVYPSKHPEGTRAELLAEQAREKLQTLCKLSSVAKMAQVDCMRRKLQQDYDTLLLAATEPGMRPPPFMQPQQMGQNVHFNPALNQMYLNSFHNSPFGFGYSHPYPPPGYPSHPYPPPPRCVCVCVCLCVCVCVSFWLDEVFLVPTDLRCSTSTQQQFWGRQCVHAPRGTLACNRPLLSADFLPIFAESQ